MTNIAIENGPVEIVDLPNDSMVIFQFVILNYQRVWPTGVNLDIERYIEWVDDCNIPSIYHLPGIPSFNIFQSLPNAYWKILKDIERYWKILKDIERYGKILKDIERYWKILKDIVNIEDIERYWKI